MSEGFQAKNRKVYIKFAIIQGKNSKLKGEKPGKSLQKSSPLGSWSKIRYLLHIDGRRSPFVR